MTQVVESLAPPPVPHEKYPDLHATALKVYHAARQGQPFGDWRVARPEATDALSGQAAFTTGAESLESTFSIDLDSRSVVGLRHEYVRETQGGDVHYYVHGCSVSPDGTIEPNPTASESMFTKSANDYTFIESRQIEPYSPLTWQTGLQSVAEDMGREPTRRRTLLRSIVSRP